MNPCIRFKWAPTQGGDGGSIFFPCPPNVTIGDNSVIGIGSIINRDIDYKTIKGKEGTFLKEKDLPSYRIEFSDTKYTQNVKKDLEKEGFTLQKNKWILDIK